MSRFLKEAFQAIEPYTPGEQPQGRAYIKLNTNESPYPPSPQVIRAISGEEVADLRLYSDPETKALISAIAETYGLRAENIIVGNGSDEVLAFSFLAFNSKEKGVIYPDITYGFYSVWAELFGIKHRSIPLGEDFHIDIEAYLAPGENVAIANPNAPTGIALSLAEIERILIAHPDDVVLIDEAYVDFGAESALSLIDRYENLLVVQTFSKSRALAGGRIGFAMGHPALIEDLSRMKYSFNPYNINRLSILAGAAAMKDTAYFDSCRQKIIATRERMAKALEPLGFTTLPSLTNFLFTKHPYLSGQAFYKALRENGILVRWFDKPRIQDFVRLTIGSDQEMDTFLSTLEKIEKELRL